MPTITLHDAEKTKHCYANYTITSQHNIIQINQYFAGYADYHKTQCFADYAAYYNYIALYRLNNIVPDYATAALHGASQHTRLSSSIQ